MNKILFILIFFSFDIYSIDIKYIEKLWEREEIIDTCISFHPIKKEIYINTWSGSIAMINYEKNNYATENYLINDQDIQILEWNPNGTVLICGTIDGNLILLNKEMKIIEKIGLKFGRIDEIFWNKEGDILGVKKDDLLFLFPFYLNDVKINEGFYFEDVISFSWVDNYKILILFSKSLKLYDLNDSCFLKEWKFEEFKSISYDGRGLVILGNTKGELFSLNLGDNFIRKLLILPKVQIKKIAFNYNKNLLAVLNNSNILSIFSYPDFNIYYKIYLNTIPEDFKFSKDSNLIAVKVLKRFQLYDLIGKKYSSINAQWNGLLLSGFISKWQNRVYFYETHLKNTYLYSFDLISGKLITNEKLENYYYRIFLEPKERYLLLFSEKSFEIRDFKNKKLLKKVTLKSNPSAQIFWNKKLDLAFFPLTEDTFAFLDFSNLKFAIVNLSAFVVGGKNFSVLPLGWKEKEFLILFFNSSIDKTFLVKLNEDAAIEYYNIKGLKNAQIKSYNKDGDEILLSCNFEWEKPYEDYIFSLKEEKFIKTNELPGAKGFLLKKAYNLFLPKDLFYDLARGLFDLKGLYELNKKKINLPFYEHVEHCLAEDDGLYFTNVEFYKDYLVLFGHGISVFKIKSLLSEKGIEFGGLKEAVLKDNTIKFSWDLPEISNYLKGNVAICV